MSVTQKTRKESKFDSDILSFEELQELKKIEQEVMNWEFYTLEQYLNDEHLKDD